MPDQSLGSPGRATPETEVREWPDRIYDQPMPDIMMRTVWLQHLPVECKMNPGGKDGPFPILCIGNYFTLYPTLEQLAHIRDVITLFLKAQSAAAALPSTETGATVQLNIKSEKS